LRFTGSRTNGPSTRFEKKGLRERGERAGAEPSGVSASGLTEDRGLSPRRQKRTRGLTEQKKKKQTEGECAIGEALKKKKKKKKKKKYAHRGSIRKASMRRESIDDRLTRGEIRKKQQMRQKKVILRRDQEYDGRRELRENQQDSRLELS